MTTRRTSNTFETPDLYFAAFLKTSLVRMKPPRWLDERQKRCNFVFDDDGTGTVQKLQLEYINDECKVSPRAYADNVKALKQLCHA